MYVYDDDDYMFICTKIRSCNRPLRSCGKKIIMTNSNTIII